MSEQKLYVSVENTASAEIVEKKSRFIANVSHAETESEAVSFIEKIKKQHYSARHNVYAYILNDGTKKYTDDGEPAKTAGLPILEMMEKQGITDIVCVVTRYFGGTLLGTGGLVRAYTESAKEGVNAAGIVTMKPCSLFELDVPYPLLGSAEYLIKSMGAVCESKDYAESITMEVSIDDSIADRFSQSIQNDFNGSVRLKLKGKVYRKI